MAILDILLIKGREITTLSDFDNLISDTAEVIKRLIRAKEDFIKGDMTISAPIIGIGELECVIPKFS